MAAACFALSQPTSSQELAGARRIVGFAASPVRCDSSRTEARLTLSGTIYLTDSEAGAKVGLGLWVDGREIPPRLVEVERAPGASGPGRPFVRLNSDVVLRGPAGSARVAATINGRAATRTERVDYACPPATAGPGASALPPARGGAGAAQLPPPKANPLPDPGRPGIQPGRIRDIPGATGVLQDALRGTLFGFADLHTHPASFLAFGGQEDGRRGMMWGRPGVGASRDVPMDMRFGACAHENHAPGFDEDPIRRMIRGAVIDQTDGRTRYPHGPDGRFRNWPSSLILSHQQIDVPWLKRAYHGGLRLIVAATVDNEVITTLNRDWDLGKTYELSRALLQGRDIRPFLRMPRAAFGFESARRQIAFIRQMVSEQSDWMEIALSGAEARRIVSAGKLAVVLGLEMDTLTPEEVRRLVADDGVRVVTPIHFVDNAFGGAAAYEPIFSLLTGIIGAPKPATGVPGPYDTVSDPTLDFRMHALGGHLAPRVNALTSSGLRWRAVGEPCRPDATSRVRPDGLGCEGSRNALGLTDAGAIEDLIRAGAIVDVAHMSQNSMHETLAIAERLSCPVVDTHTGVRPDTFAVGATERSIRESDLARLFSLDGVIGLGTGPGAPWEHPELVYYNAGNPLIELAGARGAWSFDLRQREARASFSDGTFTAFRTVVRIGRDNVERGNTLTVRLRSGAGATIAACPINTADAGIAAGSVHGPIVCRTDRPRSVGEIDRVELEHTAACGVGCTGDNVDIDELRVEADVGGVRGWLTVVQRTGGLEGEVARLKAPMLLPALASGAVLRSEAYITHILPRRADIAPFSTFRIATLTNEDDLSRSAPGSVRAELAGHRDGVAVELAGGGPLHDTLSEDVLNFPSRRETVGTVTSLTLGVGRADISMVDAIVAIQDKAARGVVSPLEIDFIIGFVVVLVGALAVAFTPVGLGVATGLTAAFLGLLTTLGVGVDPLRDNWSTRIAVWAGRTPLLVGYTPTQRLTGLQPDSTIFVGLPDGIRDTGVYAGIVVDYMLRDSLADGSSLVFEVTMTDGSRARREAAPGAPVAGGKVWRSFVPFDRARLGQELAALTVRRAGSGDVRFRSLKIGAAQDPMGAWAAEYRRVAGLARRAGQVAVGTDLSGFEPLLPFTAAPITYPFDVEVAAGRADPARARAGVPATLDVDVLSGGAPGTARLSRRLDVRTEGIATIGQLPDFIYASAQIDGPRGSGVGANLFTSVDAFVRSWERLDTIRGAERCLAPPRSP